MSLFLNKDQEALVVSAIKEAETNTSGEVRVHIQKHCKGDAMKVAQSQFNRLKMDRTELRNGVLFFVATEAHKFAILGDEGINNAVSDDFWEEIKNEMQEHFRNGRYSEGLAAGIKSAGLALQKHFPYQSDDVNELSDDISYGND